MESDNRVVLAEGVLIKIREDYKFFPAIGVSQEGDRRRTHYVPFRRNGDGSFFPSNGSTGDLRLFMDLGQVGEERLIVWMEGGAASAGLTTETVADCSKPVGQCSCGGGRRCRERHNGRHPE